MSPTRILTKQKQDVITYSEKITLAGDGTTMIYVTRYSLKQFQPRIVSFSKATYLTEWCAERNIEEAMSGGFFVRRLEKALGELWIDGHMKSYEAFADPWASVRGALYIDQRNQPVLGARLDFPERPAGDLLQAGPLLVRKGVSQIINNKESEGVSIASSQFDDDITIGRFPRSAIAISKTSMWSIVCDGSSAARTGLSLSELADVAVSLGADSALNLDGGASTTQISGGKLRNNPYGDGQFYPNGRLIYNAIIFC